jgi:hypothetical protein
LFADFLVLVSESASLYCTAWGIVLRVEVEDESLASKVAEMNRLAGRSLSCKIGFLLEDWLSIALW